MDASPTTQGDVDEDATQGDVLAAGPALPAPRRTTLRASSTQSILLFSFFETPPSSKLKTPSLEDLFTPHLNCFSQNCYGSKRQASEKGPKKRSNRSIVSWRSAKQATHAASWQTSLSLVSVRPHLFTCTSNWR